MTPRSRGTVRLTSGESGATPAIDPNYYSDPHHPVGTCRIGTDTAAVVDTELRVHGIGGLRVADASVMPTIGSGNTNATVHGIAKRAAELIAAASS